MSIIVFKNNNNVSELLFEVDGFKDKQLDNLEYVTVDNSALDEISGFESCLDIDVENQTVYVNLQLAKEQTKQIFRSKRENLFQQNDMNLRDAMLSGDQEKIDQYVTERDRLRSITDDVDAASSLDELKSLSV